MKFISQFFACLLLVLIPLQAIAATNMAVCNKMMQATAANEYVSADMPCHKHMDNVVEVAQFQEKSNSNTECESYCAAICASLYVISITSSMVNLSDYLVSTSIISKPDQAYASITQANLLRPPIFLS
jgi:hypothetical protein